VDIELETFCIDPALIEQAITPRTKAVMPVHVHGMPADMEAVNALAARHNLVVIEDACQAHGAEYKGRKTGSLGHGAAFSLNRTKNLTASEGGLYTTNCDEHYEYAKLMREFGEVVPAEGQREYNAFVLGWMYRPIEMANALARSQLRRLEEYNGARREMAQYLNEALASMSGVEPPACPSDRNPVYWRYVLQFRPDELGLECHPRAFREAVEEALRAEGIPVHQWQRTPVPAQDVFQSLEGYGRGCPWSCPFGRKVEYRGQDYPRTLQFLDSHTCLDGVWPPNDLELMKLYVRGLEKVLSQAELLISEPVQRLGTG